MLQVLENSLMRSFSCAILQYAGNVGVTITEQMIQDVNQITYEIPTNQMIATFESFILFNSLESNFLSFAKSFFEQYVPE